MKATTKNLYHERIHAVLLHIQQNLDSDLSLESLAALTHFSPVHFHRIFKGMFGETVIEHIRRIRLERAAIRLAVGYSTVTDAAFDAQYETVESFSRTFKKMFGCPPSKYQEKHWATIYEKMPGVVHYLPDSARNKLSIQEPEDSPLKVRVEYIEPMRVAYIRHTGPYMECQTAWDKLCAWGCRNGIFEKECKIIGICYDDPQVTPQQRIRYDACVTVDESIESEGEVGIQIISGGKYAIHTHKGPYEQLEETYISLMGNWLLSSGEQLSDHVSFEHYVTDPGVTAPKDLITDLYIPLA